VLVTDWGVDKGRHLGVEGLLATLAETEVAWESLTQEVERVLPSGPAARAGPGWVAIYSW